MGELQTAIYDKLRLDSALTAAQPGGLGFVVIDRWAKRDGPGKTDELFDAANGGKMRRSVIVLDVGEVQHPSPRPGRDWALIDTFPVLYLFAEAHLNGRNALEAAYVRIRSLLHGWAPVLLSGERPAVEVPPQRTGARDDDTFPGNVRCEVMIRATWARRMIA